MEKVTFIALTTSNTVLAVLVLILVLSLMGVDPIDAFNLGNCHGMGIWNDCEVLFINR